MDKVLVAGAVVVVALTVGCQQGAKGDTGQPGAQGPVGEGGPVGPQGPVGPTGASGQPGPTGPQGAPGAVVVVASADGGSVVVDGGVAVVSGPVGPQGPEGAPGQALILLIDGGTLAFDGGVIVLDGPQGLPGQRGADGQSVVGSSEPPGTHCSYGGIRFDSASGTSFVCNGTPGSQGAPGVAGQALLVFIDGGTAVLDGGVLVVIGPQGPAGSTGAAGLPGPSGAPGTNGLDGDSVGESGARFAGYTAALVDGMQGRATMHAMCGNAFVGSHMCHASEFVRANPTSMPPGGASAWMDNSGGAQELAPGSFYGNAMSSTATVPGLAEFGRYTGSNAFGHCGNWSAFGAEPFAKGSVISPANGYVSRSEPCTSVLAVACCSTRFREQFAGFTIATTTGSGGGPVGMNVKCHAEFPGSHLCHYSEYVRTHSTAAVPPAGAWVNSSAVADAYNGGSHIVLDVATSAAGGSSIGNCALWTTATPTTPALRITPVTATGEVFQTGPGCDTARPLACCK